MTSLTESCHGRFEVRPFEVLIHALRFRRRVHISPHQWDRTPWDSTSLVRNLDGDVLLPMCHDDLYRWIFICFHAVRLDNRSQRVFKDLEEHVILRATTSEQVGARKANSDRLTRWLGIYMKLRSFGQKS